MFGGKKRIFSHFWFICGKRLLSVSTHTFTSWAQGRPLLKEQRQLQRHRKLVSSRVSVLYSGWADTTKMLFSLRSYTSNIFISGLRGSFSSRQHAYIWKMWPYSSSRRSRQSFLMLIRRFSISGRSIQFSHLHRQYPLFLDVSELRKWSSLSMLLATRKTDLMREGSMFFHLLRTTHPTGYYSTCVTFPFVKICRMRLRKCLLAEKRKVRPMNSQVSISGKIILGARETILLKISMFLQEGSTLLNKFWHLSLKSFLVLLRSMRWQWMRSTRSSSYSPNTSKQQIASKRCNPLKFIQEVLRLRTTSLQSYPWGVTIMLGQTAKSWKNLRTMLEMVLGKCQELSRKAMAKGARSLQLFSPAKEMISQFFLPFLSLFQMNPGTMLMQQILWNCLQFSTMKGSENMKNSGSLGQLSFSLNSSHSEIGLPAMQSTIHILLLFFFKNSTSAFISSSLFSMIFVRKYLNSFLLIQNFFLRYLQNSSRVMLLCCLYSCMSRWKRDYRLSRKRVSPSWMWVLSKCTSLYFGASPSACWNRYFMSSLRPQEMQITWIAKDTRLYTTRTSMYSPRRFSQADSSSLRRVWFCMYWQSSREGGNLREERQAGSS